MQLIHTAAWWLQQVVEARTNRNDTSTEKTVFEIFQAALIDNPASLPLWHAWLDTIETKSYAASVATNGSKKIVDVEKLLTHAINTALQSLARYGTATDHAAMWDRTLEYFTRRLSEARTELAAAVQRIASSDATAEKEKEESEDDSQSSDEEKDDTESLAPLGATVRDAAAALRSAYKRRLAVALPRTEDALEHYLAFEAAEAECPPALAPCSVTQSVIDNIARNVATALSAWKVVADHEISVSNNREGADEEVNVQQREDVWLAYISAAKGIKQTRSSTSPVVDIHSLLLRAGEECAVTSSRIRAAIIAELGNSRAASALPALHRLIRLAPSAPELSTSYLQNLERGYTLLFTWMQRHVSDTTDSLSTIDASEFSQRLRALNEDVVVLETRTENDTDTANSTVTIASAVTRASTNLLDRVDSICSFACNNIGNADAASAAMYTELLRLQCVIARRTMAWTRILQRTRHAHHSDSSGVLPEAQQIVEQSQQQQSDSIDESTIGCALPPTSHLNGMESTLSDATTAPTHVPDALQQSILTRVRQSWTASRTSVTALFPTLEDAHWTIDSYIAAAEWEAGEDSAASDAAWDAALSYRGTNKRGIADAAATATMSKKQRQRLSADVFCTPAVMVAGYAEAIAAARGRQHYERCRLLYNQLVVKLLNARQPRDENSSLVAHQASYDFVESVCFAWTAFEDAVGSFDQAQAAHTKCSQRLAELARKRADLQSTSDIPGTQQSGKASFTDNRFAGPGQRSAKRQRDDMNSSSATFGAKDTVETEFHSAKRGRVGRNEETVSDSVDPAMTSNRVVPSHTGGELEVDESHVEQSNNTMEADAEHERDKTLRRDLLPGMGAAMQLLMQHTQQQTHEPSKQEHSEQPTVSPHHSTIHDESANPTNASQPAVTSTNAAIVDTVPTHDQPRRRARLQVTMDSSTENNESTQQDQLHHARPHSSGAKVFTTNHYIAAPYVSKWARQQQEQQQSQTAQNDENVDTSTGAVEEKLPHQEQVPAASDTPAEAVPIASTKQHDASTVANSTYTGHHGVVVRNLPKGEQVHVSELLRLFGKCGHIEKVHVVTQDGQNCTGIARMYFQKAAAAASAQRVRVTLRGRLLSVVPIVPQWNREHDANAAPTTTAETAETLDRAPLSANTTDNEVTHSLEHANNPPADQKDTVSAATVDPTSLSTISTAAPVKPKPVTAFKPRATLVGRR